jgi:hypothetical protein
MAKGTRRIRLDSAADLEHILDQVRSDGVPRLVERGGEAIAVVARPDDDALAAPEPASKRNRARLMSMAGVWRDLDADGMIEAIYHRRRSAPVSRPVDVPD